MTPSEYIKRIGRATTMEQKCYITDEYMREGNKKSKDWIKLYEDNVNKLMNGISPDAIREFAMRCDLEPNFITAAQHKAETPPCVDPHRDGDLLNITLILDDIEEDLVGDGE